MRRTLLTLIFVAFPLGTAPTLAQARRAPSVELSSIDRATDACGDFYQFACGGWVAANPVTADRQRWKARGYYAACMADSSISARGLATICARAGANRRDSSERVPRLVTLSSGHLDIWTSGHLDMDVWSSSHLVILLFN